MKGLIKKHLEELFRGVAYGKARNDKLRLDLNESVDGLPEEFIREVLASIDSKYLAMYPDAQKFVRRLADSFGVDVENVILGNGSDSSISDLFMATVSAGDRVLCTDPTFAMYPVYSAIHQAQVSLVPYDDLTFPFEAFFEQLETGIRLAVVVNPNNPTGTVVPQDQIEALAKRAAEVGAVLVVDEAYHHYLGETSLPLVLKYDNVIVTRTYSKLFGLASLRLGYSIGSKEIIQGLRAIRPTFDVNGVALAFAEALLARPDIIEDGLAKVEAGRKWLCGKLEEAGMKYVTGSGNFILIDTGRDPKEVARLLEKQNVLISSGFRQPFLASYVRVTLGGEKYMKRFWELFESAVAQ